MNIVILGAGAAGLFCAGLLGRKGHRVTVIERNPEPGRKLILTGGGRCNFSNMEVSALNYISANPHFCKSAISRYTQYDFMDMLRSYGIKWAEREHGQLFCVNSAKDILDMLMAECKKGGVTIKTNTEANIDNLNADKLIVATGGLSLPKTGASPIGYRIAESFGIPVTPVHAGLVPLALDKPLLEITGGLSGIALPAAVCTESGVTFTGQLLFTHRGLSGPVILQISNYWKPGEAIYIDLMPGTDIEGLLISEQQQNPNRNIRTALSKYLPKALVETLSKLGLVPDIPLNSLTVENRRGLVKNLKHWQLRPNGTEGYRSAEVTLGGVDTNSLSSKTMAAKSNENLYFIGEVIDVTGWLGGYNLQWCWSSAWACAEGI